MEENSEESLSELKNVHWLEVVREQKTRVHKISSTQDVADLLWPIVRGLDRENTFVIALDHEKNVLGVHRGSIGNEVLTFFDPKTTFRFLLLAGAASYVMVHNHPNIERCNASGPDKKCSKEVKELGKSIGFRMLDSVVISSSGKWVSVFDKEKCGEISEDINSQGNVSGNQVKGVINKFDDYVDQEEEQMDLEMKKLLEETEKWNEENNDI